MRSQPIYFDNNSTTPCDPRVLEAMLPYFCQKFGNPSSSTHLYGWEADAAVDLAREQIASLINSEPGEIIFTSGATESDNLAIQGVSGRYSSKGNHYITCSTEHKAVLDTFHNLEFAGAKVTCLPVSSDGLIDPELLERSILPDTVLISIMLANNETGVIQPIRLISEIAKKHGVLLFCDGAQGVGKIPVDVQDYGIDLLSISSHKIYGPKGVGALFVRRKNPRVKLLPLFFGGGQEKGVRPGTLNVPGIVGFGKAAELCNSEMIYESKKLEGWRNSLEEDLTRIKGVKINGNLQHRLPHTSSLTFPGVNNQILISRLEKEISLSSGSACTSAVMQPSYVLTAMGLDKDSAFSSIRIGLGRFNQEFEIANAIQKIRTEIVRIESEATSPSEGLHPGFLILDKD